MSLGKRGPRLRIKGKSTDKVVHPKAGRKNGEKTRKMLDEGKKR